MPLRRDELGDLMAFLAVAEERSFTRAAARLGTSQSALSHVVRRLEERLDIRLLTRTTRNVAPTEAGVKLAETLRPAFEDIETQLSELDAFRSELNGTIRITSSQRAARDILLPAVSKLMAEHPNLHIEITADQRFVDIVGEGFDAGVRLGEGVDKDMIVVRIGPEMRMIAAASPAYFETHEIPETPHDLTGHNCLNMRLPTLGGLYAWEFEKDGRVLNVRVDGQFISNEPDILVDAALASKGLVYLPDDYLRDAIAEGTLIACLQDWCPPFPGYHLYYPSRRQNLPAFRLLADTLRYRGP